MAPPTLISAPAEPSNQSSIMSSDGMALSRNLVRRLEKRGLNIPDAPVLLPLIGIVASEVAVYSGYYTYALLGHLLTLLACTLGPLRFNDDAGMFHVFILVPLFRLVNFGMPVFFELTVYWFPILYGPLIPAVYLVGENHKSVDFSAGWKQATIALPVIIVAGAILGRIEYHILTPEALIPAWNLGNVLLIGIVMVVFVGFTEELLFRGVLQPALEAQLGQRSGLLVATFVFGIMHSGYQLPAELLFAFGIGLLFGILYDKTDSLVLVTLLHGILNVFLLAVIPIHGWPSWAGLWL